MMKIKGECVSCVWEYGDWECQACDFWLENEERKTKQVEEGQA